MRFEAVWTAEPHEQSVAALRLAPSAQLIATAGADKKAQLLEADNGEIVSVIDGEHIGGLNDCAWVSDDLLVTASDDGTVKLFDLEKKKCINVFQVQTLAAFPYCLAVNPWNRVISVGYTDGSLVSYHTSTKLPLHQLLAHGNTLTSLEYSPAGDELLTSSHDGHVRQWIPNHLTSCLRTITPASGTPICRASYASDQLVLASSLDSYHRLYRRTPFGGASSIPAHIKAYTGHVNVEHTVFSAAVRCSWGSAVLGGGDNGQATLWDLRSERILGQVDAHRGALLGGAVLLDPCGELRAAFTAGADGRVVRWALVDDPLDSAASIQSE